jgi:hypothetical protein
VKARSAALQGGLALAGLIAAYFTWQRPRDAVKADAVVVLDAAKNTLERVRYEDGTRAVELDKKDRLYVTLSYLPGKRPELDAGMGLVELDGGVDGGAAVANVKPAEPLPDRTLYANDRGDLVWTKLSPFEGTRALGQLSGQKLEEVGLVGSSRKLELTVSGVSHRFTISRPVQGLIGNYAQNEKTGDVFIISSSLFNELDPNSQVLVDRRLHLFKPTEFDGFTVKSGERSASFVQTGADIPQTTKVARTATPDKAEELVKNWHDKLLNRLIVTEVLGRGELPRAGEPKLALRVEYTSKGQPKGWVELGVDGTKGTWARSENTIGWVAVHQGAEELIIEGARLALE